MKKIIILGLVIGVLIVSSCKEETETVKETVINNDSTCRSEYLSYATIWYQKSAENRAIYYQTYSFAKMMFDKNIKESKSKMPKAVITDIDETVLDNSAYNAQLIEKGTYFNYETWKTWVNERRAKALPGALEFCNYVKEKGAEVFYVSNRHKDNIEATVENLKNAGFPFADSSHVLLKTETSDKTERRNTVTETHELILLMGDNLRDFDEIFGNRGDDLGFNAVDENKNKFGEKFIIFPNPIYGEWEKSIYDGNFKRPDEEKRKMRIDILDK